MKTRMRNIVLASLLAASAAFAEDINDTREALRQSLNEEGTRATVDDTLQKAQEELVDKQTIPESQKMTNETAKDLMNAKSVPLIGKEAGVDAGQFTYGNMGKKKNKTTTIWVPGSIFFGGGSRRNTITVSSTWTELNSEALLVAEIARAFGVSDTKIKNTINNALNKGDSKNTVTVDYSQKGSLTMEGKFNMGFQSNANALSEKLKTISNKKLGGIGGMEGYGNTGTVQTGIRDALNNGSYGTETQTNQQSSESSGTKSDPFRHLKQHGITGW